MATQLELDRSPGSADLCTAAPGSKERTRTDRRGWPRFETLFPYDALNDKQQSEIREQYRLVYINEVYRHRRPRTKLDRRKCHRLRHRIYCVVPIDSGDLKVGQLQIVTTGWWLCLLSCQNRLSYQNCSCSMKYLVSYLLASPELLCVSIYLSLSVDLSNHRIVPDPMSIPLRPHLTHPSLAWCHHQLPECHHLLHQPLIVWHLSNRRLPTRLPFWIRSVQPKWPTL